MTVRSRTLIAAVLLLGAAGCSNDGAKSDTEAATAPSPGATPTASAAGTTAPACVAGTWRAAGVTSSGDAGSLTGRLAGGADATMTIGADGTTQVTFTEAEPVTFTMDAAGAQLAGQIEYSGKVTGAVVFEPSATGGRGTWNPRGETSGDGLQVTVKLTDPVSVTLLDEAGLGAGLSDATDALDTLPVLRGGTYQCSADSLRVRTERNGPTMTWTFTRTSR